MSSGKFCHLNLLHLLLYEVWSVVGSGGQTSVLHSGVPSRFYFFLLLLVKKFIEVRKIHGGENLAC